MEETVYLYNSTICRLCAEANENGEPLFSEDADKPDISTMVNRYLPLKLQNDGKLPQTICPGCNIQLESTIQFFDLVTEGQKKIRELWKQQVDQERRSKRLRRDEPEMIVESLENDESTEITENPENFNTNENTQIAEISGVEIPEDDRVDDDLDQQIYLNIMPDGSMYASDHEIRLQMEGLEKPRRKRGRPPKMEFKTEILGEIPEETSQGEEEKQEEDIEEEDDGTGRRRRKRKIPERFKEAVQGKELDRIFKEEGVFDEGDYDRDEDYFDDYDELKTITTPEGNEIIGHLETVEGKDLGELVVINKNRGRGRPKRKKYKYVCEICGKGFHYRNKHMLHRSMHKNIRYKCVECGKQFSNEDNFYLHQKTTSHAGRAFVQVLKEKEVDISTEVIPDPNSFANLEEGKLEASMPVIEDKIESENTETNLEETPGGETLIEEHLSEENQSERNLAEENPSEEHLSEENPPGGIAEKFICDKCPESFPTHEDRDTHVKNNHSSDKQTNSKSDKGFPCDICGKVLNHPSSILYHKEAEHNDGRRFVCNKCGKSFKHKQLLQRHQLVHSQERPYLCKSCDHSFKTKANLINHQSTHTGEKKYFCDECGQRFAHKTSLTLHHRTHSGDKPYKCDVCKKTFSQNGNLQEHMRIHTGEKPFCCDICGRKFTTSSQFNLHKKRHTGEKPWKCEFCEKSFLHKDTWKCHVRRHKGEKPFQCHNCPRAFTEQWALKKHERLHTGEKPYSCDVCGKAFADCSNLTKHKKVHKEHNRVVDVSSLPEGTSIGEVWEFLPNSQDVRNHPIGNRVTEVITTENMAEGEVPQIFYVSYQDSETVEQPRMLHFVDSGMVELKGQLATVDGQTLHAIRIQEDEVEGEEALIENEESEEKLDDDIPDPYLEVQIMDDEGNPIPLSLQAAQQLLSEGKIISKHSDGEIVIKGCD